MTRKIIATMLIGGSLIFALLIITQAQTNEFIIEQSIIGKMAPTVESLSDAEYTNGPITANITELIGKSVSEAIVEKNPEGALSDETGEWYIAPDPEKIAADYLQNAVEKFNINDLKTPVDKSKIRLSTNNSKAALETYVRSLRSILEVNFQGLNLNYANLSPENLELLVTRYQKAIAGVYGVDVPSDIAAINETEIVLLQAQQNVFKALLAYTSDSLKAILAAQANIQISKEFADLKKVIETFIIERNLTI